MGKLYHWEGFTIGKNSTIRKRSISGCSPPLSTTFVTRGCSTNGKVLQVVRVLSVDAFACLSSTARLMFVFCFKNDSCFYTGCFLLSFSSYLIKLLKSMSALLICDHKDMWTVCDKDQIAPRVAQIAVIITAITAICDTGIKSRQSTELLSSMCNSPRHL